MDTETFSEELTRESANVIYRAPRLKLRVKLDLRRSENIAINGAPSFTFDVYRPIIPARIYLAKMPSRIISRSLHLKRDYIPGVSPFASPFLFLSFSVTRSCILESAKADRSELFAAGESRGIISIDPVITYTARSRAFYAVQNNPAISRVLLGKSSLRIDRFLSRSFSFSLFLFLRLGFPVRLSLSLSIYLPISLSERTSSIKSSGR